MIRPFTKHSVATHEEQKLTHLRLISAAVWNDVQKFVYVRRLQFCLMQKKNAPSILFWFVAIMLKHHNQPLLLGNFDWF